MRPIQFRVLEDDELRRIHDASLRVLEEVGVRVAAEELCTALME